MWNESASKNTQIRTEDLVWNFFNQDLVNYEFVEISSGGLVGKFLTTHATDEGVFQKIPKENFWISLWCFNDIELLDLEGQTVLENLVKSIQGRGFKKITFGGDEFHFLPGAPNENSTCKKLSEILNKMNFQFYEVADLGGELPYSLNTASPVTDLIIKSNQLLKGKFQIEEVATENQKKDLQEFLKTEFPGRWLREYECWLNGIDSENRATWLLLRESTTDRPNGSTIGFSRSAIRKSVNCNSPSWSPGAIRLPIIADWNVHDGCLGPIGVAKSQRGKGAGSIILGQTLFQLIKKKTKNICIDWTDAFGYYEKLSFQRIRNYKCPFKKFN